MPQPNTTSQASHDGKITRAREQLTSWTQDVSMKLPTSLGREGRQERETLREGREWRKNAVDNLDELLRYLRGVRDDQLGLFMLPGETYREKIQSSLSEEEKKEAKPEPEEVLKLFKSFQDELDTVYGKVKKAKEDVETMKTTGHTKADLQEVERRAEVQFIDAMKRLNEIHASKEFQDSKKKCMP